MLFIFSASYMKTVNYLEKMETVRTPTQVTFKVIITQQMYHVKN